MNIQKHHQVRRFRIYTAAACVFIFGMQLCHAQAPVPGKGKAAIPEIQADARADDVETAFWACDYVATLGGVDVTPVELCNSAYTRLKEQKFGGDFDAMLDWWRANKVTEHLRIESRIK